MGPMLPSPYGSPEVGPNIPQNSETAPNQGAEYQLPLEKPALQERKTGGGVGDNTAPPLPVVPLPPSPSIEPVTSQPILVDDSNPSVAADEDLIEKEWVEKAKQIISDTKDDPFAQEQAVRRLQADYLHKRYGKVIKLQKED